MLGILLIAEHTADTRRSFPLPFSTGNQTTLLKLGRVPSGGSKSRVSGGTLNLYIFATPHTCILKQNPIRLTYKSNPSAAAASMLTVPHPREEAAFASLCFLVMVVATTGLCVGPNLRLRVAMLPAYAIIITTSSTRRKSNFLYSRRINNALALF